MKKETSAKNILDILEMLKRLKEANYVIVASPKAYAVDSIGSSLLIHELLSHKGMGILKPHTLFCAKKPRASDNSLLEFVETELDLFSTTIPHYTTPLCIVVVDHGSFKTCCLDPAIYQHIPHNFIGLDHHPESEDFPKNSIQIVDTNAASTTAIIYKLLRFQLPITRTTAIYTALGIMADIGGKLTHPKVNAETLQILVNCIKTDIPWEEIQEATKPKMPLTRMYVWTEAYKELNHLARNVVSLVVHRRKLAEWRGNRKDIETFFGTIMCALEYTNLAILIFEQNDGSWRISFRSRGPQKNLAAELAKVFGGGGHAHEAAAIYLGDPYRAEGMILSRL